MVTGTHRNTSVVEDGPDVVRVDAVHRETDNPRAVLRSKQGDTGNLAQRRAAFRNQRAFMGVQAKAAPGVAIFHSAWPHAMFASTARAGGARIGFWQHAPVTTPAWPDRWARFVRPDFTVFNSRFTQARPAFPDVPGQVIHCAVATPPAVAPGVRRSLRQSLGAGDNDIVVLMAARLERWKGHEVLIEAAKRVPSDARIHVWIAGADREAGSRHERDLASAAATVTGGARVNLLGFAVVEVDMVKAVDRPQKGWSWIFNFMPGF